MQSLSSPTERRQNVRNAFYARPRKSLKGATVLLVDDVLTTGSTCHHAARALRNAGAQKVIVAAIARGEDVGPANVDSTPKESGAV
jgi:predicted amidophosphoribosyltransferase